MAQLRTLVAGHVTQDRFGERLRAGGALYCARVHQALGSQTRLVTALGRDFACAGDLAGLEVEAQLGDCTTCFTNLYPAGGLRVQRVDAIALPVVPPRRGEIPDHGGAGGPGWDALHLAPVIGELDLELWKRCAPARKIAINVQGWVRRPVPGRAVRPRPWAPSASLLGGIDVACLSEEDLEDQTDLLERLVRAIPLVALTQGPAGCDLFVCAKRFHLSADPADCVDPTGAGDAFAATLLHQVALGEDPVEGARLASAVAAIAIEGEATSALERIAEAPRRSRRIRVEQ